MKSLKFVCCASLLFSIIPAAHARPARHKTARAAAAPGIARLLQDYYNRGNAAAAHKDLDGALRYFSQDFQLTDKQGNQIDIGEVRYRLSSLFDMAVSVKSNTSVASASQHGNTASALIHESTQCVVVNPDTGKKGVLVDHAVARDTWTHTEDGWVMTTSQEISSQETLNGRAVTAPPSDTQTPGPGQQNMPPPNMTPGNDGSG